MLDEVILAVGLGASGSVLTSFDNLALLVALMPAMGRIRALMAFWAACVICLSVSLAIALGLRLGFDFPGGYVGLLPISLGLWRLWQREQGIASRTSAGFGAAMGMYLLLSGDSLAVLAPLLADTMSPLRPAVLAGAMASVMLTGLLAAKLVRLESLSHRLDRVAPWLIIAIGLYILADTGTD